MHFLKADFEMRHQEFSILYHFFAAKMSQDNVEIENEESFAEKCQQILNDSSAGILMCVGWRLGLFDSLGSFDHPVTSLELAEKCQMKER